MQWVLDDRAGEPPRPLTSRSGVLAGDSMHPRDNHGALSSTARPLAVHGLRAEGYRCLWAAATRVGTTLGRRRRGANGR